MHRARDEAAVHRARGAAAGLHPRVRGRGSNAAGIFYAFVDDPGVKLVGVEAGGRVGCWGSMRRRCRPGGRGFCTGARYVLQDEDGQTADVHSVSAGLDYPRWGRNMLGRMRVGWLYDGQRSGVAGGGSTFGAREGIITALSGACGVVGGEAGTMGKGQIFIVNLSGRGDKDTDIYREKPSRA